MGGYVYRYAYMFMNNFLAQIQVRLSPYFVRHTLGLTGRGEDKVGEGSGMCCTELLVFLFLI